ncbi:uncharacterized protein Sirt7 [Battus philenor]|uniref:uncharacterized protein Sirt7 n=1 Tax=Battus philenor TaxID=42288 RepID=UPI0035CEE71C
MGGGVRSSARLSGGAGRPAPRAAAARSAAADAAARAAAAERRARAAERAREVEDSPRVLRAKCRRLARAVRDAKHLVVYTGAGISTAADIPDYRGPHGVWTRLQRGETVGRVEVARAQPTFTHMALTALWASGALKFVVSQNCDGLHLRAGLPRRALAELHGDMFAEQCAACRRVYLRAFDTTERTARHAHATRRLCHACGRELRDTIVHFGERGRAAWPLNWAGALRHAAAADVVLCLGSSLKVLRRYPTLWRMQRAPHARPALYIVNLQWTPKDAVAALKINARCDAVMAAVARRLRLRVPRYSPRRDPLLAHAVPLAPLEAHTTRRAPLDPPPLGPDSDSDACYSLPADDDDDTSSSGSSACSSTSSDEDDRLPLGRLAERLRAVRDPPPPARNELFVDHFRSFQVSMRSCEATILLRAEHAPSVLPPPEPPPRPNSRNSPTPVTTNGDRAPVVAPSPPASNANCPHACGVPKPCALLESRGATSDLRRFRIQRVAGAPRALHNGHASPHATHASHHSFNGSSETDVKEEITAGNGAWPGSSTLRRLLECTPSEDDDKDLAVLPAPDKLEDFSPKSEPKTGVQNVKDADDLFVTKKCKVQLPFEDCKDFSEVKNESGGRCKRLVPCAAAGGVAGAGPACAGAAEREELCAAEAAAAAFIRRAVLVCRASLYPGLHTIVGGTRGCAWCSRRYGARRCLWYGAPPEAGAVRAVRRLRGRRYLCACCPAPLTAPAAASAPAPLPDDAGWYGKGYRKGRRRRR